MLRRFALLEGGKIERLRLAALLALNERLTDILDFGTALLFPSDQVADGFAIVCVTACFNLGRYPFVLLLCQSDCLPNCGHGGSPKFFVRAWRIFILLV
jgi:hypothetical protein